MGPKVRKGRLGEILLLAALVVGLGAAAVLVGRPFYSRLETAASVAGTPTLTLAPEGLPTDPPPGVPDPVYPPPLTTPEPLPLVPPPVIETVAPSYPGPDATATASRSTPHATPSAQEPYNMGVSAYRDVDVVFLTQYSETIVIGRVAKILPLRWDTADGRRPPNPHAMDSPPNIFSPVMIEVEQVIKGRRSEGRLMVMALGGQIGRDSVVYEPESMFTFQEGERVLLFLQRGSKHLSIDGFPLQLLNERYTITSPDHAVSFDRTVPLSDLLQEIQDALEADAP